MRAIIVTCDRCHGLGKMPMRQTLRETFAMVPRKGGITAYELAEQMPGITANAQNNRLERLRDLELVCRRREGKFWRYFRT